MFVLSVSAYSNFNYSAAATYAKKYYSSYNSSYKSYADSSYGDSANFVSQALLEGGMPKSLDWYPYSNNWYNPVELADYLKNVGCESISNPSAGQLSVGDVISYGNSERTSIVTDVKNGVPYVCAHGSTKATGDKIFAYGVDISYWNSGYTIDFAKMKESGIDFVIIRAGTTYSKDSKFDGFYTAAKAAGLDVGAYYYTYAKTTSEALVDAQNFIKYIGDKKLEYPAFLDIEDDSLISLTTSTRTAICTTFMEYVKSQNFYTGLYCNSNWLSNLLDGKSLKANYDVWLASWTSSGQPDSSLAGEYTMHQYSEKGNVPGHTGDIDLDVSFLDYPSIIKSKGMNNFAKQNVTPATPGSKVPDVYTSDWKLGYSNYVVYKMSNFKVSDTFTTGYYTVSANSGLNMRSTASTSGVSYGRVPVNTTLNVTKISGQWGYTSYNSKNGWVYLIYTVPITPAAPKLTKVANADGGVQVTWESTSGATAYRIYQMNGTTLTEVGKVGSTENSFIDKKVESGKSYKYTVRAEVSNSLSEYDEKGLSITYLAQPTVTLKNNNGSVTVKWNKITGADTYYVYRHAAGVAKWDKIYTSSTALTYTDSTVQAGTRYYYTVKVGKGTTYSSYVKDCGIIYLSQPVITVANADKGVSISWDSGKGAKGYYVYRRSNTTETWKRIADVTETSYVDTTASSGSTYYYTVKSYDGTTYSTYNSGLTIKYLAQPTVSAKTSNTGITISWNKITGATSYILYRHAEGVAKWDTLLKTSTATTYTDTTAKKGIKYYYTVKVTDGKYNSSYVKNFAASLLAEPTVALLNCDGSVRVKWGNVEGADGVYVYRRMTTAEKWVRIAEIKGTTETMYYDTDVESGSKYMYTVKAYKGTCYSTYNSGVSIIYLSQPSIDICNAAGGIKVNFGKVEGATGYYVFRRLNPADKWVKIATVNGNSTFVYTDANVTSGVDYSYTVRAINGSYTGSYNSGVTIMHLVAGKVTSLKPTDDGITVNWEREANAKEYYIYRKEGSETNWTRIAIVKKGTTTSYTDSNVIDDELYTYCVRPKCDSTMGSYSNSMKCTYKY